MPKDKLGRENRKNNPYENRLKIRDIRKRISCWCLAWSGNKETFKTKREALRYRSRLHRGGWLMKEMKLTKGTCKIRQIGY